MAFFKNIFKSMTTILINGISYSGGSITVSNNRVMINGKDVTPDGKEINISVEGNIDTLKVDACNTVTVKGDVKSINTMSGDVDITGEVKGNIETMSGDVECGGAVGGSIKTMSGDVKHR